MGLTNPIVGFKLYTLGWGISKSKPLDSKITHSLRSLSRLCTRDRNSCRLIEYYWDVHYGLCFSCIPLKVDGNLCVAFYEEHPWGGKRTPLNHSLLCTKLVFGKRNVGDKHPSHVCCMWSAPEFYYAGAFMFATTSRGLLWFWVLGLLQCLTFCVKKVNDRYSKKEKVRWLIFSKDPTWSIFYFVKFCSLKNQKVGIVFCSTVNSTNFSLFLCGKKLLNF